MRNVILVRLGRTFEITGSPPVGNVGDAYSFTFGTTGGTAPIIWSATSLGSSGATFSAGTISSASLTNAGNYTFTVTAIDATGQIATATFVLVVIGAATYRLITEGGSPIVTQAGTPMRPQ